MYKAFILEKFIIKLHLKLFMEKRVVIFGDSITWGANDYEHGGWVSRLRSDLESNSEDYYSIYNQGISGDNTEDLLFRFEVESASRHREKADENIVIFAIGINDSQNIEKKDNFAVKPKQFENNLKKLIELSKKYYNKIVFIGLTNVDEKKTVPIPWSKDKSYYSSDVKMYDKIIEKIAKQNNCKYIEMFDVVLLNEMKDGLHPDKEGHEKMYLKIKKEITKI